MNLKNFYLPDQLDMKYKNVTIQSPETEGDKTNMLELHGWFVYHEGKFVRDHSRILDDPKQHATIVYFHENDYCPPARLYMIEKLYKNHHKYNVLMIDYRGYGQSQGSPTEEGTKLDAIAIMQHVFNMEEVDKDSVYIFGASYGGVLATYAALNFQEKVRGLILQNTIASALSLAESRFWFMKPILPYITRLSFPSIERISKLTLPIMFIISLNDELTPPMEMYKLYNAATNSVYRKQYEISMADHYSTWYHGGKEFDEKLSNFIDSCKGPALTKQHLKTLEELKAEEAKRMQEESKKTEDL